MHDMPYKASLIQNFLTQLHVTREHRQGENYGKLFEDTELNIQALLKRIKAQNALNLENDPHHWYHFFSGVRHRSIQSDLLNFRNLGQELYESHKMLYNW